MTLILTDDELHTVHDAVSERTAFHRRAGSPNAPLLWHHREETASGEALIARLRDEMRERGMWDDD